jgi:hypothetical protein
VSKSIFILILAAAEFCVCTGQTIKSIPEQTVFRESEPIHHAVPLPPKVLEALLETKEVKEVLGSARGQQGENPSQLFRATQIRLAGPDEVDLVVEGISPVSGADNTWFWIVSSADNAPTIILWAGANSLEVMATATNGYRNVRSSWSSPTMTQTREYHFDGQKYALWKETTSDNRH